MEGDGQRAEEKRVEGGWSVLIFSIFWLPSPLLIHLPPFQTYP